MIAPEFVAVERQFNNYQPVITNLSIHSNWIDPEFVNYYNTFFGKHYNTFHEDLGKELYELIHNEWKQFKRLYINIYFLDEKRSYEDL